MSLSTDKGRYAQAFQEMCDRSTHHESMKEFISRELPNMFSGIGHGKSSINVLGIGSGTGTIDIHILSKIQDLCPGVPVNNHVIEPYSEYISKYQELVTKTTFLGSIHHTWHNMKVEEYQSEMEDKKEQNKYDFIHMIEVVYYVKDIKETLNYLRNCLAPGGKLLMILVSENSGWDKLYNSNNHEWSKFFNGQNITGRNIKTILEEERADYEYYHLPAEIDISECYVQGSRKGELLMEFLTHTIEYFKVTEPDRVIALLDDLKSHNYSNEKNGKIFFQTCQCAIVIPQ